jgi:hypothetical protein
MKRVKVTIEVLVDVENWIDDEYRQEYKEETGSKMTKQAELDEIKDRVQDLEILSNNLKDYKVISVKETKQEKFKW